MYIYTTFIAIVHSDHLAVERKAFASSHSWRNNVDNILLLLAENKY